MPNVNRQPPARNADYAVADAVRQMALAAWDKFGLSCAWFMPKTDFATVQKVEIFLSAMRENGGMEAWNTARNIEKNLP
jgi:hypothetical protein